MNGYRQNMGIILLTLGFLAAALWGCAGMKPAPTAKLEVIPSETALTPDLLKNPIEFRGSGFTPNEMVVVDLMIPKGVKIKTVSANEESVGLAYGNADGNGNFQAKMGATATLNWLFQVGWTPNMKPVFQEATPLPPGAYEIRASGAESDAFGVGTLTIIAPPKKQ
jgi:hypothetical protein